MRAEESSTPSVPVRTYLLVYLALMALLFLTWGAAYLPLGMLKTPLSFTIAMIKAGLVAAFFMHLRGGTTLSRIFAAGGLAWLAILFGLTLSDYLSRGWTL